MAEGVYIARTLLAEKGRKDQRLLSEHDLAGLKGPLIILGDPGLGKTQLAQALEKRLGGLLVSGGTFYRTQNLSRFRTLGDNVLIIDGLDEISTQPNQSAVDEVLKKLSLLGWPRFVLSCRAADWQGSADRHKILADYGEEPTTLLLQPFSRADAIQFLQSIDASIDAQAIVDELEARDLEEFCGNPLTLKLIAELAKHGQGLPQNRADLLERSCELLVTENNPAHHGSQLAHSSLTDLLDSAGAIFAHLLLSGTMGVSQQALGQRSEGFVLESDLAGITDAPQTNAVLKTRLFQSAGENLTIPFHKVVAEFLAARWLSKQLSNGLSQRRLMKALTFANGVPAALRGVHAWLAFFNDVVADECIRTDPYGVLRNGEPGQLSLPRARLLLRSLDELAGEDPYFRSEDWGRRAVAGLARKELKPEILELIKRPNRHFHLSTLLLEALPGSSLTSEIVPELVAIVEDPKAIYSERVSAAEALCKSNAPVDWTKTFGALRQRNQSGEKRLALEIIAATEGEPFSDSDIADALVDYQSHGRQNGDEDDDDDVHVAGMDYAITKRLSPSRLANVMDFVAEKVSAIRQPRFEPVRGELASTIYRLSAGALAGGEQIDAPRLLAWLRSLNGAKGYSSEDRDSIRAYLDAHPDIRREVQRLALTNRGGEDSWMVIAHDLPQMSSALTLNADDAVHFLRQITAQSQVTESDAQFWQALLASQRSTRGLPNAVQGEVNIGIEKHDALRARWEEFSAPPKRDWQKESEERETRNRAKRLAKFEDHRAEFRKVREGIGSGAQLGALRDIANGYLNRYTDLDHDASPEARLQEWLGDDLTSVALTGFVEVLKRTDLPSASQIAESHAVSKAWNSEPIITCGILELVRQNKPLTTVGKPVLESALATWWEYPDFNSNRYGEAAQTALENAVFDSEQSRENFLIAIIEPRLAASNTHIPGLYRLVRDDKFSQLAAKLAPKWLLAYPNAKADTQWELLHAALGNGARTEILRSVVAERLKNIHTLEDDVRKVWMAAAFILDLELYRSTLEQFCAESRENLWAFRNILQPERSRATRQASPAHYEFVIQNFSAAWGAQPAPRGASWGDTNAWNASEFIKSCIGAIGSLPTVEASDALDKLANDSKVAAFSDYLKHVRAQQKRLRRDNELKIASFAEVKAMLAGKLPAGIDDLKAMLLDRLEIIQDYVRNSDTNAWEAFWLNDRPKDENTCRHRLVDLLRPRMPAEISWWPETLMPEEKRADIVAIYNGLGLPIEIKGQWHPEVWDAAKVQLIEKYARDWRANDRGIYLVLWAGSVRGKNMPRHPEGRSLPKTPLQFREMIVNRLSEADRAKIDVVVFDISRPKKAKTIKVKKNSS